MIGDVMIMPAPGPYECVDNMVFAADGDLIATVGWHPEGETVMTAELLAASWEMREALIAAKWVMDSYVRNPSLPEYREVVEALRKTGWRE